MVSSLLLGSAFIVSGILVLCLGKNKGVFNTELWGSFPILQGLHEYTNYIISTGVEATVFKQFGLALALASRMALLAASIEFLGVIPKPFGKLISLVTYTVTINVIFASTRTFETMENTTIKWWFITTTYFSFLHGIVIGFIAIVSIITSYY